MDDNKSLWNKTTMELTVKDQLVIAVVTPAIVVGGMIAAGAVAGAAVSMKDKVQAKIANRKNTTPETI